MNINWRKILGVLILVLLSSYLWFVMPNFFPPGKGLNESDWLSFWGSFLSFSGTVVLGIVAWKQTIKANDIAKKSNEVAKEAHNLSKKLVNIELEKLYPYIIIDECFIDKREYSNAHINISQRINFSRSTIKIKKGKSVEIPTIKIMYIDNSVESKYFDHSLTMSIKNCSETVIHSIKIKKIETILFLEEEKSKEESFEIKEEVGLTNYNAIMPNNEIYLSVSIISNVESLRKLNFIAPTTIILFLEVNTLYNTYEQEIMFESTFDDVIPKYKFEKKVGGI